MKIKLLAVAVAMAVSTQASASILGLADNGTAEAMFNIWDPTTNRSYTQDLGVTFSEFLGNLTNTAYSLSFGVDAAVYNTALGASNPANLIWNVSVAEALNADFGNFENYGIIGTNQNFFKLNDAALNQAIAKSGQMATAANGTNPVDGQSNFGTDLAYAGTIANGGYAGNPAIWGFNWAGSPTNNTAHIGTDMSFWYQQADLFFGDTFVTEAAGKWSFDGSTLGYAAPSAVPVPAAVWLFGSGLIGLVGVARRKSA